MKIAVPFEDGQVFQHFGRSAQFKFYEAENGQLLRTEVIPTNGQGHGALAGFLVQHGADVLLCGGIGHDFGEGMWPGSATIMHFVDRSQTASRSRNNPYHGRDLPDPVVLTMFGGTVTYQR